MCSSIKIERTPFSCPYTSHEWNVIMVNNVINYIRNYKSVLTVKFK